MDEHIPTYDIKSLPKALHDKGFWRAVFSYSSIKHAFFFAPSPLLVGVFFIGMVLFLPPIVWILPVFLNDENLYNFLDPTPWIWHFIFMLPFMIVATFYKRTPTINKRVRAIYLYILLMVLLNVVWPVVAQNIAPNWEHVFIY